MPDLNLIDEGGFDETPVPAAPPARKKISKGGGGGGGGTKFLIIVLILALIGGALYYLNSKGIVKLWGKKKAPIAQFEEEPFMQEPIDQFGQEQIQEPQQPIDTSLAEFIEPVPIEEKVEPLKEIAKKEAPEKKEETIETESISELSEMSGEFTIQVIAYREKSRAVETSKNLEYAGYPSFVEKIPMNGGDFYTVRIGRYPSREEAQKAVKTFASQLQAHYVIDKIRNK